MANKEHLKILKQGVKAWNKWRKENIKIKPDLSLSELRGINLIEANLSKANLSGTNLRNANLCNSNLKGANLWDCYLKESNLSEANLIGANLYLADLFEANLNNSNLSRAELRSANLSRANLRGADLRDAFLTGSYLIETDLRDANLSNAELMFTMCINTRFEGSNLTGCKIYGFSAWDLKFNNKTKQVNVVITKEDQPIITIDNIEIAQFVYILLNRKKLRDIIDTISGKAILILGRFGKRKKYLDAIADHLRKKNLLPIIFDFESPKDRDTTETILTLAGLCKFVIADLTSPKSVPQEAQATIPNLSIPFVPLIQEKQKPYSMFSDLMKYKWVLEPVRYKNITHLKSIMDKQILAPAEKKHKEIEKFKERINKEFFT